MSTTLHPNASAIRQHLDFLADPARGEYDDALIELAYGKPDDGPKQARLYGLDEFDKAVRFAVETNNRGNNLYVGVALRQPDANRSKRCSENDFYVATALPIDIDDNYDDTIRRLKQLADPHLMVTTGVFPEPRAHAWVRLLAPCDDKVSFTNVFGALVSCCGSDQKATGTARIMRLGGTVSHPNKNKMAKGYISELTTVSIDRTAPLIDIDGLSLRLAERTTSAPACASSPAIRPKSSPWDGPERSPFGFRLKGRRDYMIRLIWANLIKLRRTHAFCCPKGFPEKREAVFGTYTSECKARVYRPGLTREQSLEAEGRGQTLFDQLWNEGLNKWNTKLASEAGLELIEQSEVRTADADTAAEEASISMRAFFEKAERSAVMWQRWKAHTAGVKDVLPLDRLPVEPAAVSGLATIDVGLGKTELGIRYTIDFVNGRFEGPGPFDKALWARMVEYIVGNHRLAEEVTNRFNAREAGIALHWRGMGQQSPHRDEKMCRRFEDMTEWMNAGGRASDMCANCPFNSQGEDPCDYVQQYGDERIIVVASSDGLTTETTVSPLHRQVSIDGNELTCHADLIVQDETRLQNCLGGFDG